MSTTQTWIRGLAAAVIGAGSNAITLIVVDPLKFNLDGSGLKNLAEACLVSGLVAAAMYLKQSPLPPPPDQP